MNPPPVKAISDQFASSKETCCQSADERWAREIELVQRHKAEEDLAVAAASILARQEFVTRLAGLGREFEMELPRGASAAVDAAAKEFIAKYGAEGLPKAAKMHFRTALRAQGLPEPPKTEWRRAADFPPPAQATGASSASGSSGTSTSGLRVALRCRSKPVPAGMM
jgi:ribonuclease HIII